MEDKSPTLCRLCDVSLASPSEWRQHAKSDWHVYNLRVKVAEPGTIITPPASPKEEKAVEKEDKSNPDQDDVHMEDESADEDDEYLSAEPEFKPGQCLFCNVEKSSFDESLAHMSKVHSFSIPHQEHLTVDCETLVGYLHLVVYGYGECILCGARRSTVEGIQHHMTAKGHCRFNVALDIAEFYEIPEPEYHADEESLRLPSGKLLNHRTKTTGPTVSKKPAQAADNRLEPSTSTSATHKQSSDVISAQDGNPTASSSTQLSRLTRGEQQSLAHLPDNEVRALLAANAKSINQAKRAQTHAQLKMEKAKNVILMSRFRMDTSMRFRGLWG